MLIAKVTFTDVDGKSICENYTGRDVEDLIDRLGYNISDEYNDPRPKNPKFKGLNGVFVINKPIEYLISLVAYYEKVHCPLFLFSWLRLLRR